VQGYPIFAADINNLSVIRDLQNRLIVHISQANLAFLKTIKFKNFLLFSIVNNSGPIREEAFNYFTIKTSFEYIIDSNVRIGTAMTDDYSSSRASLIELDSDIDLYIAE